MLIYMNYVIVRTISQSRKMFGNIERTTVPDSHQEVNKGMQKRQTSMKNSENQLTIMLLLVTTLFLILLCPTYIRFIYLTLVKRDTPFKYASSMLFYQISNKLYFTNNAINFFLYCISGQKFRNDLKELLCCTTSQSSHISKARKDESQSSLTVSSIALQ